MTLPVVAVPSPLPPLGNDLVGFIALVRAGTPDAMGEVLPTPSTVWVENCRHRAGPNTLPATETPEQETDVATEVWITHAPPVTAALGAKTTGQLTCNGKTFQITGVVPVTDADGAPYFVKIFSKRQEG